MLIPYSQSRWRYSKLYSQPRRVFLLPQALLICQGSIQLITPRWSPLRNWLICPKMAEIWREKLPHWYDPFYHLMQCNLLHGIYSQLLKMLAPFLTRPFTFFFNKTLVTVKLANCYSSKHYSTNDRAVNLISIAYATMKRLVRNNILLNLTWNILLNDAQHGFTPKRSTPSRKTTCL